MSLGQIFAQMLHVWCHTLACFFMPYDMPGLLPGSLPPVWQASPTAVSQLDELHVDTNLEVRLQLHPRLDLVVAVNRDQLAEGTLQRRTSCTGLVNCWGGGHMPVG